MNSEPTSSRCLVKPPIVDEGYAWMYVFATFMMRLIYDGFLFSIGVFHEPLYRYFGSSNAATSLVPSILFGVDFISGPFASCLVNRFGCRKVSVSGSLIATSGVLLSLAMPRIEYLYITIGLLCGFGVGLMDLTTVAIIGVHFDKKRATAMGLSFSGSGFGSLLLAPLMGWLNHYYGFWKGTMLIVAGLLLNCTVLSLLYSDVGAAPEKNAPSAGDILQSAVVTPIGSTESSHSLKRLTPTRQISDATQTADDGSEQETDLLRATNRVQALEATTTSSMIFREQSRCMRFADAYQDVFDLSVLSNYVYLIYNLGNFILCLGIRMPFVYISHRATELELATPEEASFLIAIIGVSNTLGRLVFGALADRISIKRINMFNAILMVNGLSHFTTSLITKYYQMALYCFVFGITFGGLACMTPVVLVDLLGIRRLNTSYGLLGFTAGIAISIGTPLTGMLYDKTHTYEQGFYVSGGIVVASALFLCSIPIVQKICPQ